MCTRWKMLFFKKKNVAKIKKKLLHDEKCNLLRRKKECYLQDENIYMMRNIIYNVTNVTHKMTNVV